MGFFGKLFVMLSAALGLFVSGLDLLERFDVDVNAWLRGIPPVISTLPEGYGDWVDRFVRERLGGPGLAMSVPDSDLQAGADERLGLSSMPPPEPGVEAQNIPASSTSGNRAATLISAGIAALMLLILAFMSRRLFRRI